MTVIINHYGFYMERFYWNVFIVPMPINHFFFIPLLFYIDLIFSRERIRTLTPMFWWIPAMTGANKSLLSKRELPSIWDKIRLTQSWTWQVKDHSLMTPRKFGYFWPRPRPPQWIILENFVQFQRFQSNWFNRRR